MAIIQDASPQALPPGKPFPPGTKFTARSQVHASGNAETVRVRYALAADNNLAFAGNGKELIVPGVLIRPEATVVDQDLTLERLSSGTPVKNPRITIQFLPAQGSVALLTTTLRILV